MKHVKKLLIALLIFSMLFTLAACGGDQPEEPPADEDEVVEQQTFFDFDTYTVELKDAQLLEADYGFDCLMLTLTCSNYDSNGSGRLGDRISYTATQNGEELTLVSLSEYWEDAPTYVNENESADFYIGFGLELEYNQVYYDLSEIEVVLQDKDSDLSYTFTVDPSELDTSGLDTGVGKGTGETESFGDFESILVPAEFTLERDGLNEDNPHYISVKNSSWAYFIFRNFANEEEMMEDYEYDKEYCTDGQTDVSATYNGIDWTGFQYDDGYGGYNFEVYTVIDGNYLRVSSVAFTFDDLTSQQVLGSVVMAQ